MSISQVLEAYDYHVPKELIATHGIEPRESARLMVVNRATGSMELARYADLPSYLPPGTVLVFNETKVIPARFKAHAERGDVEITVTGFFGTEIQTLSSRRIDVRGTVTAHSRTFTVSRWEEKFTYYETGMSPEDMRAFLDTFGYAPLPPYIKDTPLDAEDTMRRYQTVFAKHEGSVAAPTAALHFSETLLEALRTSGIQIEFVTLHVGLGTFLPLTQEHLEKGTLHTEEYRIDPDTAARLNVARREGKRIIPVGTTSLRTLESAATQNGELTLLSGSTDLFIRPGYTFKVAQGLITNFHVPQSSLLMLVDAFLGGNGAWRPVYERAIAEKFRLFSFGDGMLIL